MELIDVNEAKDRLDELIARARAGERVVITEQGRPVAALTAETEARARDEAGRRDGDVDPFVTWWNETAPMRAKLPEGAPDAATLIRRMRDEGH